MTMSVGLGKITSDPQATALTRKALGILSTPGLIVYDDAITIDETGRLVLKVHPEGGMEVTSKGLRLKVGDGAQIAVGENGVALTDQPTIGIDSNVELNAEGYDREWNARFTGSAPNFVAASLAIGAEELGAISDVPYAQTQKSKVQITSDGIQLRLGYNLENHMEVTVDNTGKTSLDIHGSDKTLSINAPNGVKFNGGLAIKSIVHSSVAVSVPASGAVVATSYDLTIPAPVALTGNELICGYPSGANASMTGWGLYYYDAATIGIRYGVWQPMPSHSWTWFITVIRF